MKAWTLTPEERHYQIWSTIFRDETWLNSMVERQLNPVLVGYDLYNTPKRENESGWNFKYLTLVLGMASRDGNLGKNGASAEHAMLLKSLQPHEYLQDEIYFTKKKLVLNIYDCTFDYWCMILTQPDRLIFQESSSKPLSAYLYWRDETYQIRAICSQHIVGLINGSFNIEPKIVSLKWEHLPECQPIQHVFATSRGKWFTTAARNENGWIANFKRRPITSIAEECSWRIKPRLEQ